MTSTPGPLRLFVTGTDTNVGKTHVTCLIARQLIARGSRVAAYKPVCSGAVSTEVPSSTVVPTVMNRWDDVERLKSAIGGNWPDELICPQRFLAPLAPPIAARLEGRAVSFPQLVEGADCFDDVDVLLIEGVGGWLSPVTETKVVADLARAFQAPVLIVARAGLGTISHTLMTIESVRANGLTVVGVILNEVMPGITDPSIQTNGAEIEARSGVPVLGTVPYGNSLELFQPGGAVSINWRQLADATPPPLSSTASPAESEPVDSPIVVAQFVSVPTECQHADDNFTDKNPMTGLGWPASVDFLYAEHQPQAESSTAIEQQTAAGDRGSSTPDATWSEITSGSVPAEASTSLSFTNSSPNGKAKSNLLPLLLIVGTYASLLTIFLVFLTFFNRAHQLESLPDLKTVPQQGGRAVVPRPENDLPFGHQLRLGQSQRFGDIRVTPLRVTRGPLHFVPIESAANQKRPDSARVLKLWLRFENVGVEQSITPLDTTLLFFRRALDDRVASYNVIFKAVDRNQRTAKFYYPFDRISADSEWRIVGQKINEALSPREALETFIPSEERIEHLSGDIVWRVHFRKGYGPKTGNGVTTLIDVRFNSDDVIPDPA